MAAGRCAMARRSRWCSPLRGSSRAAAKRDRHSRQRARALPRARSQCRSRSAQCSCFGHPAVTPVTLAQGAGDRTWGSSTGPGTAGVFAGAARRSLTARPQPPSRHGTERGLGAVRRHRQPARGAARANGAPRRHATCTFRPGSQSRARHKGSARGARTGAHRPGGGSGRRGHPQLSASARRGSGSGTPGTSPAAPPALSLPCRTLDATTSAAADVALKRDAEQGDRRAPEAQRTVAEAPPDSSAAERAALQSAVRQAADDVAVAQLDVSAAVTSAAATRAAGADSVAAAGLTGAGRSSAARMAAARLVRADQALSRAARSTWWAAGFGCCGLRATRRFSSS